MASSEKSNGRRLAEFIAASHGRNLPPEVTDAARLCLADWLGVALGARDEPAGRIVRDTVAGWRSGGSSTVLFGSPAAAPFAALANGALAHCLDFDDTYVAAVTHVSAPVWAAVLALGEDIGADGNVMLSAFVTGFEVASRAGHGLGEAVTARGWHSTGVFGRLGAAAAGAALLGLDAERALHALGGAATQIGGLTASFGTMAKPFHAGKAAMDGIVAAQLAANGFEAATGLLEPGGGLDNALVQDGAASFQPIEFTGWNILCNSFKPYAACHLVHPVVDAARALAARHNDIARIDLIRAEIGALADKVTGGKSGAPSTALEGKFDLKYCVALGLHGHDVSAADFREPWRPDPAVCATAQKVTSVVSPEMGFASARLTLDARDSVHVPVAKGHPGNPIGWDDMHRKFSALVEPVLGRRSDTLFGLVREFGCLGVFAEISSLLAEGDPAERSVSDQPNGRSHE
ncbi:MAG TPA: MmgE/PrpD family protein [Stellaceae bacterium]|jgi:2-methylcitrate dehydratase PrpD|nr:MmgE/PrpD family protein [Stellaceae bacterium]